MERAQDVLKTYSDNMCCTACYTFVGLCCWDNFNQFSAEKRENEIIYHSFLSWRNEAGVDEKGYVNDPAKLLESVSDRSGWWVEKKEVSGILDTKGKLCLARFVKGDKQHFVVMYDCKIIYNPISYSHCVAEGEIKDIRLIHAPDVLCVPLIQDGVGRYATVCNK